MTCRVLRSGLRRKQRRGDVSRIAIRTSHATWPRRRRRRAFVQPRQGFFLNLAITADGASDRARVVQCHADEHRCRGSVTVFHCSAMCVPVAARHSYRRMRPNTSFTASTPAAPTIAVGEPWPASCSPSSVGTADRFSARGGGTMNTSMRSVAACGKVSADRSRPQPLHARFAASALFRQLITHVNRHRLASVACDCAAAARSAIHGR